MRRRIRRRIDQLTLEFIRDLTNHRPRRRIRRRIDQLTQADLNKATSGERSRRIRRRIDQLTLRQDYNVAPQEEAGEFAGGSIN